MNAGRRLALVFLAVAATATAAFGLQRQQARLLREQIALLQVQQRELLRLRAENQRLQAAQPAERELTALRSDHIAAERLRAELNTLRDSIRQAEVATAP